MDKSVTVKVDVHASGFSCQVRREAGWTAICACGMRFPIRRDTNDAYRDMIVHEAQCRPATT